MFKMEGAPSIPANTTTDNVAQGKRFERAPFNGRVTLYATGSAAGLEHELNIGGRSASGRDPVNTQNRQPLVPDDLIMSDIPVRQGELIQLSASNTTAGALVYRWRIEIDP